MSYRMWKSGNKTNDYKMFDKVIGEQYNIGGVDAWLYTYEGPKGNNGSTDSTKPDYSTNNPTLSSLGDYVFGETVQRKYNTQAITLVIAYQIQEATPDIRLPGLFFSSDTMDITIHYNTMMQLVGRKIIAGDVLELPNLRDADVIGSNTGVNRFYVVQDSFRASEGYSATWHHHIWKMRVKPLTDSPEFADLLGDNGYLDPNDPNNPDPDDTSTPGSNAGAENDIMSRILYQADAEVPYIHFDNEHIFDDSSRNSTILNNILTDYTFPVKAKAWTFFNKKYIPVLMELVNGAYKEIPASFGTVFDAEPQDADFFFLRTPGTDDSTAVLYQYYKAENRWIMCDVKYVKDIGPEDKDDYYVITKDTVLYQLQGDGKTWAVSSNDPDLKPFTSSDIAWNPHHPHDIREGIPPARGDVGEGSTFPIDPPDGTYFYRTDYTPVSLWRYETASKKWTQFNYGGRLPWTGANQEKTNYINSPDAVSIKDVVLPNIKYRKP